MITVKRNEESHTGHACYRTDRKGRVTVLCPYGHYVASIEAGSWGSSTWLARSSFGDDVVTCHGKVRDDAEPYPFRDTALGAWATVRP